jgi:hypothetical protein
MDCAKRHTGEIRNSMANTSVDGSSDFYSRLDGTILQGAWHVRVASVVVDDSYRWIQLDLVGPRRYSFLFRLMPAVDSTGVRQALQCWLAGHTADDPESAAPWDGIVAMHMVTDSRSSLVPSRSRKTSFVKMVESAFAAVSESTRVARRVLGRM